LDISLCLLSLFLTISVSSAVTDESKVLTSIEVARLHPQKQQQQQIAQRDVSYKNIYYICCMQRQLACGLEKSQLLDGVEWVERSVKCCKRCIHLNTTLHPLGLSLCYFLIVDVVYPFLLPLLKVARCLLALIFCGGFSFLQLPNSRVVNWHATPTLETDTHTHTNAHFRRSLPVLRLMHDSAA